MHVLHTAGMGAGVAFFKLSCAQLAIVRASKVRDVKWAGVSDTQKLEGLNGMLDPRASFNEYVEKGRHESKKWSEQVRASETCSLY